jgi:3-oxoacyl-[acyl-carrier protein] reductase
MKLKNKIALITGASKGIGASMALLFAKEGAKVIVNYNNDEAGAQKVVQAILDLVRQYLSRLMYQKQKE